MFDKAVASLASILKNHPWVSAVAGILPLSALIDFIDVPLKLHVFQLVGGVPLWSWPITPAGSRLLLSRKASNAPCCLDEFGNSVGLVALDGRYGEEYFISSPETFRLAVQSNSPIRIENLHANMTDTNLRRQDLEIIHVTCRDPESDFPKSKSRSASNPQGVHSIWYIATSLVGWVALISGIVATVILRLYLATAYFALMPVTGLVVFALYGSRPRRLLVPTGSGYNRLIVVAHHMNAADWDIVYGDSTLINSLLNRPLEPMGPEIPSVVNKLLNWVLQLLILGQWALAIGATATTNWNAFFITFWIMFCIFSQAYILTPASQAGDWLRSYANLEFHRYQTQVSSRRALLNTIVALNPDTFAMDSGVEDRTKLNEEGMRCLDPILKPSSGRSHWEEATRKAMNEATAHEMADWTSDVYLKTEPNFLSVGWNETYRGRSCYWKPYILEGIYMATTIRLKAHLTGRRVSDGSHKTEAA